MLRQSNSDQSSPQFHSPSAPNPPRTAAGKSSHASTAATLSVSEDNSISDKPAAGYNDAHVEFSAATCVLEQAISCDLTLRQGLELASALRSLRTVVDHNQLGVDNSSRGVDENGSEGVIHPEWKQVRARQSSRQDLHATLWACRVHFDR